VAVLGLWRWGRVGFGPFRLPSLFMLLLLTVFSWLSGPTAWDTSVGVVGASFLWTQLGIHLRVRVYNLYNKQIKIMLTIRTNKTEWVLRYITWWFFHSCSFTFSSKPDTLVLADLQSSRWAIVFLYASSTGVWQKFTITPSSSNRHI